MGRCGSVILVPFTTFDNGNTNNCVPYRTNPDCTAWFKLGMHDIIATLSVLGDIGFQIKHWISASTPIY